MSSAYINIADKSDSVDKVIRPCIILVRKSKLAISIVLPGLGLPNRQLKQAYQNFNPCDKAFTEKKNKNKKKKRIQHRTTLRRKKKIPMKIKMHVYFGLYIITGFKLC